jgi:hypothetical protein
VSVAAGFLVDPDRAAFGYLAAWTAALSLAGGALALLMVGRVTGAIWFVALRRPVEAAASTLPFHAALFLPVALAHERLYPWDRPDPTFASAPLFVARSAAWLLTISWLALALVRARDDRRARALSAIGLPVLGLAFTGGTVDWLLSLDATFASTVLPVYVLTGGFEAALALTAIALWRWRRAGTLPADVGPSHFHSLGKLLFTLAIFWAYIAYAQGFIVWIADVPTDAAWLVARTTQGWGLVLVALILLRFVAPFLLLLPRATKRSAGALAAVSAIELAGHCLDAWWLVLPQAGAPRPSVLDAAALLGVAGTSFAVATLALRGRGRVPAEDPRLAASLRYETT